MGDKIYTDLIRSSVIVIGYQREDHKMYPHLYDFLHNLRSVYEEVLYLDDDDRGEGLYSFDVLKRNFLSRRGLKALENKLSTWIVACRNKFGNPQNKTGSHYNCHQIIYADGTTSFQSVGKDIVLLLQKYFRFFILRKRLQKKLSALSLRSNIKVVLAIDHTASLIAQKFFPGRVILWSFDIPTRDYTAEYHMRMQNGSYEKYITSADALKMDAVIIQDESRKLLLEKALGIQFKHIIYLPVSLNDSVYCRNASIERSNKTKFKTLSIIQSGGIGRHRFSDIILDSFQNWPAVYELTFHGSINNNLKDKLNNVIRKPHISNEFFCNDRLPAFLDRYDIGFVGYGEGDTNHDYIENASAQLVSFLKLGIPIIACGSSVFNDFITRNNIGYGLSDFNEMPNKMDAIRCNYGFYSRNSRNLYEARFDLQKIFHESFVHSLECVMKQINSG